MTLGSSITIRNVSIAFDGGPPVIAGIDLDVPGGEFICLLGPSGCGKSTLLNAIAGFASYSGEIRVDDVPVTAPGRERGVVFQSSEALFPWLTAQENVEYGLRIQGVGKAKRAEKALRYLDMVGLGHAVNRFPAELSGGMRQRLQIARVLVNEPSVILMDEPFGALDAQTREVMQFELDRIWRATTCTVVFVTHDIGEALLLGERVVTMTTGPEARLKTVARIDLAHPRDPAQVAAYPLYNALREDIAVEVHKVLRRQGVEEQVAS